MYLSIVIFPDSASDLVATQIESLELDFPNTEFLRSGVLGWLVLYQSLPQTQTHFSNIFRKHNHNQSEMDREKQGKTNTTHLVFQHVKKGGLASIVETQEKNLGLFLPQAQRCEHAVEPIKEEHVLPPKNVRDLLESGPKKNKIETGLGTRRTKIQSQICISIVERKCYWVNECSCVVFYFLDGQVSVTTGNDGIGVIMLSQLMAGFSWLQCYYNINFTDLLDCYG